MGQVDEPVTVAPTDSPQQAAPVSPQQGTLFDDPAAPPGGLLPAAYEVVSRLTVPGHQQVPIRTLTRGAVDESDMPPILAEVRTQAVELRRLLLGD